jgi:hypothetical protein
MQKVFGFWLLVLGSWPLAVGFKISAFCIQLHPVIAID